MTGSLIEDTFNQVGRYLLSENLDACYDIPMIKGVKYRLFVFESIWVINYLKL